jgi:hypothetical protein
MGTAESIIPMTPDLLKNISYIIKFLPEVNGSLPLTFSLLSILRGLIMKQMHITIGEHLVQVACASVELMNMFERNFHCIPLVHDDQPDILIQIEEGYGVPFVDYEVTVIKESNKIFFRRADYLIEANSTYGVARISVYNGFALKHALINLYSSYIVHENWGLLLHSSCVIEHGKAHIFAGQSGAGKSTAAQLSYPRELLSDEATLVKITPDQILVFNSPFRSEVTVTGMESCSPLASINILYQADHNKRISLRKSNGLLHLMDKVFYWTHNTEETGAILGTMKVLANAVPIYELYFQKNNTFWELIS